MPQKYHGSSCLRDRRGRFRLWTKNPDRPRNALGQFTSGKEFPAYKDANFDDADGDPRMNHCTVHCQHEICRRTYRTNRNNLQCTGCDGQPAFGPVAVREEAVEINDDILQAARKAALPFDPEKNIVVELDYAYSMAKALLSTGTINLVHRLMAKPQFVSIATTTGISREHDVGADQVALTANVLLVPQLWLYFSKTLRDHREDRRQVITPLDLKQELQRSLQLEMATLIQKVYPGLYGNRRGFPMFLIIDKIQSQPVLLEVWKEAEAIVKIVVQMLVWRHITTSQPA